MQYEYRFAYAYGSGQYGATHYAYDSGGRPAGGNGSNGAGSLLTDTGFDIAVVVTLACVVALIAVVVRYWRRPANRRPAD